MFSLTHALIALLAYVFLKIFYRLTLHPLAKVPGPKIAAATSLYSAYHDICTSGLVKSLPDMHKKYGPVIRIMPNEVHVSDFEAFCQIFRVGTPFTRIWHGNPFLTGSLQSKQTLSETKKRKEFLSPFFSKAAITRVEPFLHRQKLSLFLSTLEAAAQGKDSSLIDFFLAFRCLTADTIMDYCFQKDLNALSEPEFKSETIENMIKGMEVPILMIAAYFPRFSAVFDACIFALPEEVRKVYFAPVYSFQTMQRYARERVEELMRKKERGGEVESKIPTMFDAMLWPDADKGQVTPPKDDMVADGSLMIAAGTDTTANVLGTALWHVSQDKEVERKLVEELKRGIPDREDIVESARLEGQGFEYLRAVVKESLRVSYGVPGRIPRRVPKGGATFNGVFVPEGITVTSGQYLQNIDPVVFPDPFTFDPERWMCDPETYKVRDRYMTSFSRGSRACIGINLAYATLHLTVAHMFRRFEITTEGHTTQHDMDWNDRFIPVPNGRIKGVVTSRKD